MLIVIHSPEVPEVRNPFFLKEGIRSPKCCQGYASIKYKWRMVYFRRILSHAEYNRRVGDDGVRAGVAGGADDAINGNGIDEREVSRSIKCQHADSGDRSLVRYWRLRRGRTRGTKSCVDKLYR